MPTQPPSSPSVKPISSANPEPIEVATHPSVLPTVGTGAQEELLDRVAIPLTFREVDRLSRLLGFNVFTGEDIINCVTRATSMSVNGISITLEPGLATRIQSRIPNGLDYASSLRQIVLAQLHSYVGW